MREKYQYLMDSCLLPNTSRFGTVNIFEIQKVYYNTAEVVYAEIKFSICCKFIWNWLVKHNKRQGLKF